MKFSIEGAAVEIHPLPPDLARWRAARARGVVTETFTEGGWAVTIVRGDVVHAFYTIFDHVVHAWGDAPIDAFLRARPIWDDAIVALADL